MKYYFYTFKNQTGRRASVREFITRQTCKICDYTVDYMLWQLPLCIGYTLLTSLTFEKIENAL
jgi:hypothetical protein